MAKTGFLLTCRYGENWYGPGWPPGEVFRPSRDVCAMPFSATDMRVEALHTYANVTVRAGCAGASVLCWDQTLADQGLQKGA